MFPAGAHSFTARIALATALSLLATGFTSTVAASEAALSPHAPRAFEGPCAVDAIQPLVPAHDPVDRAPFADFTGESLEQAEEEDPSSSGQAIPALASTNGVAPPASSRAPRDREQAQMSCFSLGVAPARGPPA